MLCKLCRSIDFRHSSLHQETRVGFVTRDTLSQKGAADKSAEYYLYSHHPSLQALQFAAEAGCHLCTQILSDLTRSWPPYSGGRQSDKAARNGPIEIRYYLLPKAMVAVMRTPSQNAKVIFELVQYDCKLTSLQHKAAHFCTARPLLTAISLAHSTPERESFEHRFK